MLHCPTGQTKAIFQRRSTGRDFPPTNLVQALLGCYNGKEEQLFIGVVYKAVAVTFGAVVAIARSDLFGLIVEEHLATPAQNVDYLAVVGVGVHSYRCTRRKPTAHNFVRLVGEHTCCKLLFATTEVVDRLLVDQVEIDFHIIAF